MYVIMCDTETFGTIESPIPYNVNFTVADTKGNLYETHNFLVEENWEDKERMATAYYADKIPLYEKQLADGEIVERDIRYIFHNLRMLMEKYDTEIFVAHNARFDVRALNNLMKQMSNNKKRYFLPYGTDVWDTMAMANDTICKQKGYVKFCEDNGYMTKHTTPRVRKTAEILYRYISKEFDFVEEHRAMEDVMIEAQILAKCFAQHKPMTRSIYKKN